jgi:hypothetical protein
MSKDAPATEEETRQVDGDIYLIWLMKVLSFSD